MEQEASKISNPLLPSILPDEVVQLTVAGTGQKVRGFWEFIKHCPSYQVDNDLPHQVFDKQDNNGKMHIVMEISETSNQPIDRKVSNVQIQTENGKNILITLQDTKMVEMLDGIVYIHGVNFDIFACPTQAKESREVVEIEEIEEP